MKKVRYLIGAVGAVPALGVLAPAASAAVSRRDAQPNIQCTIGGLYQRSAHVGTGQNKFTGRIFFGRTGDVHCLYAIGGWIDHSQTGLSMRARAYWHGNKNFEKYVPGAISFPFGSSTTFSTRSINKDASQACEALVYTTNHNKVAYGPVCEPVSP